LPRGAVSRAEDADGHMALRSIASGSPILKDALSDQAAQGLSERVPQAYRAYAVSVSEANIAGGFVQAGDRVDLYVTLPSALFADAHAENRDDRSKAALLLQSVEVLAVGVQLKGDGTPQPLARTVTLAVSAADLAKLALATRLGSISFAIRNPADTGSAPVAQAELATLAGDTPVTASVRSSVPTRARRGVPLYAGRSRSLVAVP
jgi:pilus assembly protein CpaB